MFSGVKLEGFGLLPNFRGKGLGRELLTQATEKALAKGARKVWLHTATDDHPNALPNYLAAGYRKVRERELKNPMPILAGVIAGKIRQERKQRGAE
jgi:ribosomal protein S18 acetylase RimI-like enzyme